MIVRDLRILLEKLNHECTRAVEAAVGSCVHRGHHEMRWEHVLLALCESDANDVSRILRRFEIDAGRLQKALASDLEQLPAGGTGKPSFAPSLVTALETAWGLATLCYGRTNITSGVLFTAAFEDTRRSVANHAAMLRAIDAQRLQSELDAIVAGSSEQADAAIASIAGAGAAAASAEVLERFCSNVTREARDGAIDPITGRDSEIRQVIDILSRRRKNNPILVGEAGVGKTAVAEGLALRIAAGDVPDNLKGIELYALDLGLLQAGASVKGEFEKRLKDVITAVAAARGQIILFIDEAHTLIGAGNVSGQGDAANLLKPALARGELRALAATTWAEYRRYFEKDPALARRFQRVAVDEPDEETAVSMLRGIVRTYEKHHGVHITERGIRAAVALSHRYMTGRRLPDKAVDVLDTAATRVKMSRTTTPASLDRARRRLEDRKRALEILQRDSRAGIDVAAEELAECESAIRSLEGDMAGIEAQWEREKQCVAEIVDLYARLGNNGADARDDAGAIRAALEKNAAALHEIQGETPLVFPHVSREICARVIGDWTQIPMGSMLADEAESLLALEDRVRERVLGQDDAVREVSDAIRAGKAGIGAPDAPLGVFLFVGPSGVGKTECALALADILFGGEKFLTVINMSEYQEKHTVSQLKGSPPGYVGYGEGGILTEAVRRKPYSIVVLDEGEKAHIEVMNLFYQVFDKGFMRDGEGREIDFRNTVIIMTSNLASSRVVDMCAAGAEPSAEEISDAIRPVLSAHFQPALLGRMTVVPFRPLGADMLKGVAALKLDRLARRIHAAHGIEFGCTCRFLDAVAARCTTVEAGARMIDVIVNRTLVPAIARHLLAGIGENHDACRRIVAEVDDAGEVSVAFESTAKQPAGGEVVAT
ncbi:MAG: type VI secretion system ATPase TssH [Chitinivibrionales bacterium]|nr:type VI secretion system ATPase TssH [Chitinivibrionales bacterium]MBD3394005.1 type VI secretion system ATPase TssH [Chitinivibrionales bacterium]